MNIRNVLLAGLMAAFLALTASAQLVTLTSTTTSAAIAATDRVACLTSASGVNVPGVGTLGSTIVIDKEPMQVRSVTSVSTCFNVNRSGRPVGHASGATVYIGSPNNFYTYDPDGTCVVGSIAVRPWINLSNGVISDCVSSLWTRINGPATQGTGLTSLGPTSASTVDIGSDTLPFRKLYLTSAIQFEGATADAYETTFTVTDPTADRTVTFPDASITVSGANAQWCGTTNTCAATDKSPSVHMVAGITAALDAASPSVATVASISPAFTSTTSYACTGTVESASASTVALATTNISGSSFKFVGPNGGTAVIHYLCIGY